MIVGGAQESVMLTADLLDKEKFDVTLITGIETGPEGGLISESKNRGIKLRLLPELVRNISPVKDSIALWKLYKLMKIEKFDIVHTQTAKARFIGTIAAKMAGIPIVLQSVHGWSFNNQIDGKRTFYIILEKIITLLTNKNILVSTMDKENGIALGIGHPNKYVIIRPGIDINNFEKVKSNARENRKQVDIPEDVPLIGIVGRLSRPKTPDVFLRAARIVVDRYPSAEFLIVGDGHLRGSLEELCKQLGLSSKVHFLGLRRDVPELLSALDILVHSSLWEALGKVIIEGKIMEKPIVATNVGGVLDIIEDQVSGLLVNPNNHQELARAIMQLLKDKKMAKMLAETHSQELHEFSVQKMIADTSTLYFSLFNG